MSWGKTKKSAKLPFNKKRKLEKLIKMVKEVLSIYPAK